MVPNEFFANRASEAQAGLSAFFVSLVVFVILFIAGIYKTPVQMYKELGGFVENPFILDTYLSKREKKEDEDKWASLVVRNNSPSENIEDCFLRLIDIIDLKTDKSIIEDVQNLTWSGREHSKEVTGKQAIRIVANHEVVCDVARTHIENIWGLVLITLLGLVVKKLIWVNTF